MNDLIMLDIDHFEDDEISLDDCPICGEKASLFRFFCHEHHHILYGVECQNGLCLCKISHDSTEEDAAERWNKRLT